MKVCLAALCLAVTAGGSTAQDAFDRLRELATPPPPPPDEIYAEDMAADRALIAAESITLFDPARPGFGPPDARVAIVLFIGPACPECAAARADLAALADRLAIRASVIDVTGAPDDAALMGRLSLDLLPSYVTPNGMIRGAMPAFVLERDLSR